MVGTPVKSGPWQYHYCDITWALWYFHPKSMASRLLLIDILDKHQWKHYSSAVLVWGETAAHWCHKGLNSERASMSTLKLSITGLRVRPLGTSRQHNTMCHGGFHIELITKLTSNQQMYDFLAIRNLIRVPPKNTQWKRKKYNIKITFNKATPINSILRRLPCL